MGDRAIILDNIICVNMITLYVLYVQIPNVGRSVVRRLSD